MSGHITILSAGPAMTVQDMGRAGYLSFGLTRGGAADTLALHEAAALLDQDPDLAAIEMVGAGGTFQSDTDTTVALTGAQMSAQIDGATVAWNASHPLPAGAKLTIDRMTQGTYGYLSVAGGFDVAQVMGARATHLTAGIGTLLKDNDTLPMGTGASASGGLILHPEPRFSGGEIRVVPSVQTSHFAADTLARFEQTEFTRDPRANRQGVRLATDQDGFFTEGGLSIVSEVITEGDIQMTGDGAPYVLMCECQTTGGYPRIGTVIPCDLPRVAQASVGATLRFCFVTLDEARTAERAARTAIKQLLQATQPMLRDPADIADLLSYQLISGVTSGTSNGEQD